MTLNLLGIRAVPLHTIPEDGFIPSVERCARLITSKTKAIALVTPNNPVSYFPSLVIGDLFRSRRVQSTLQKLLAQFTALARQHKIALVVDETYRDFILQGPPHTIFHSSDWRQSFVHLFSFSKSYAIPGFRLGGIVASPKLLVQIEIILDCLQICPPMPPQIALGQILPTLRPFVKSTAQDVAARHQLFKKSLPSGWKIESQGGYFAYVRHPFKGIDAKQVCMRLATEIGVVTLPGSFFHESKSLTSDEHDIESNGGKWLRFSVANVNDEDVKRICERLKDSEAEFGWETNSG